MNALLGAVMVAAVTVVRVQSEEICSAAMSVWPVIQCSNCDPTKLNYGDEFDVQMWVKNMAISQSSRNAVNAELKPNSKLFLWFGCRQSECTSMAGALQIMSYTPQENSAINIFSHASMCNNDECAVITIFDRISLGVPSGASLSTINDAIWIGTVLTKVVSQNLGGIYYLRADSGVADLEIPTSTGCIPVTGGGQGSTAVVLITTTTSTMTSTTRTTSLTTTSKTGTTTGSTTTTTTTSTTTTTTTSTTTTTTWRNYCCAIFENVAPESHFCFPHMEPIANVCDGTNTQSAGEGAASATSATEMVAHSAMAELMTAKAAPATSSAGAQADDSHADLEYTLIGVAILMAVSTSVLTACSVAFCMKRSYLQLEESLETEEKGAAAENARLHAEVERLRAELAPLRLENAQLRA